MALSIAEQIQLQQKARQLHADWRAVIEERDAARREADELRELATVQAGAEVVAMVDELKKELGQARANLTFAESARKDLEQSARACDAELLELREENQRLEERIDALLNLKATKKRRWLGAAAKLLKGSSEE